MRRRLHPLPLAALITTALTLTAALPATAAAAPLISQQTTADGQPVAEAPQVTDRLITKFTAATTAQARQDAVRRAFLAAGVPGETDTREIATTADGATVIQAPQELELTEAEAVTGALADDPTVLYAEPDRLMTTASTGADEPTWGYQWSLQALRAPEAWDAATGAGVTVGVVDTGLTRHDDLDESSIGGRDFITDTGLSNDGDGRDEDPLDPATSSTPGQCWSGSPATESSWHGSLIGGIIAAPVNSYGITGLAPDADLLSARALGACGTGHLSDIADAVDWLSGTPVGRQGAAQQPAQVINLSFSTPGQCGPALQAAVDRAVERGVTVVAAAGNQATDEASAPASCDGVIGVGAVTRDGHLADYSNTGANADVLAPGGGSGDDEILSASNTGTAQPQRPTHSWTAGTSAAAAHVSATVALMLEQVPDLTPEQVEQVLRETSFPIDDGGAQEKVVDPAAALLSYIPPAVSPFADVPVGTQFYKEMAWVAERGISTGWPQASGKPLYKPLTPINRDAMAAFLYRDAGQPAFSVPRISPFADVSVGQDFYEEMNWVYQRGISTGWAQASGKPLYKPLTPINRDAMAAFLYRAAGSPDYTPPARSPFTDVATTQQFYKEMAWVAETGIATGWDNGNGTRSYRPLSPINRDAMAAFLYRAAGMI